MAPQASTKHVSCHRKPGTTPPPSQAYMPTPSPTPSPMPVSHPHNQQHHHHDIRFDLFAASSSMSRSFRFQADSSSQLSTRTSPCSDSYTESTSSSSSKPASEEAQTDQGPPCNNCHQPSKLCTVGPLNPKGNAGRKYFACKRCPYGLAWVGWASESFGFDSFGFDGVVVAVKDEGVGSVPSDAGFAGGGSNVDGRYGSGSKEPQANGEGSLVTTLKRGKRWGISSPGSLSEGEADDRPRCCCGGAMKLDYVDVSWDSAFYSPGEKRKTKKWFWTCTYGACGEFIWVEDTGGDGLAHHGGCKGEKRMRAPVRILW